MHPPYCHWRNDNDINVMLKKRQDKYIDQDTYKSPPTVNGTQTENNIDFGDKYTDTAPLTVNGISTQN